MNRQVTIPIMEMELLFNMVSCIMLLVFSSIIQFTMLNNNSMIGIFMFAFAVILKLMPILSTCYDRVYCIKYYTIPVILRPL